jgi:hypothetical protein
MIFSFNVTFFFFQKLKKKGTPTKTSGDKNQKTKAKPETNYELRA